MIPIQIVDLEWRDKSKLPAVDRADGEDWIGVYQTLRALAYGANKPSYVFDVNGRMIIGLNNCGETGFVPLLSGPVYVVNIPAEVAQFCRLADRQERATELRRSIDAMESAEPGNHTASGDGRRCDLEVEF